MQKINIFYSLRYNAYAKFENLEFWITWIVDKLHIKLMFFAWTIQKLSSKGHLKVTEGHLQISGHFWSNLKIDAKYANPI